MTAIWNPTTQTTPYWCYQWLTHPGLAKFVFGLELMVVARAVDVRKMHVHVLILILSMSKLWAKGFPFHLVLFVLDVTLNPQQCYSQMMTPNISSLISVLTFEKPP